MGKMFFKRLLFLFLSTAACFTAILCLSSEPVGKQGQSKACTDYELGPPEDIKFTTEDFKMDISWKPPMHYEDCAVTYTLHIQDMNTSEYWFTTSELNDVNYRFRYHDERHVCQFAKVTVFANYGGQTSIGGSTYDVTAPVTERNTPYTVDIYNNDERMRVVWTKGQGAAYCFTFIIFRVWAYVRETGEMVNGAGQLYVYEFDMPYSLVSHERFYCKDIIIEVIGYFRGQVISTVRKQAVYGPPSYCAKKKKQLA